MLSEGTVAIIKQIAPAVVASGEAITRCFYKRLASRPDTLQRCRFRLLWRKLFMQSVYSGLRGLGADESRINFEFFGPRQELVSAARN